MHDDWQPIETAPKDGTIVLIWPAQLTSAKLSVESAFWHQPANPLVKGFWVGTKTSSQPMYWMSLPEPPKEAADAA